MEISSTRTQWPVGQGFFHSGTVTLCGNQTQTIHYVYDCGSCSPKILKTRISDYVQTIKNRKSDSKETANPEIKLFFVSHFDRDHINGITTLSRMVDVDRFIIPFVKPEVRLFNFAHMMTEDVSFPSGSTEDQFVVAVTISPEEAFLELTSGPEERYRVIQIPPSDSRDLRTIEIPSINLANSTARSAERIDFNLNYSSITASVQSQKKIVWQWESHALKQFEGTTIAQFREHLVSKLNSTSASYPIRINDSEDIFSKRNMRHWVKDPDNRKILKDAYRKVLGENTSLNRTSLMLYSGPPSGTYAAFWSYSNNRGSLSHSSLYNIEKVFREAQIDDEYLDLIHGGRLLRTASFAAELPQLPSNLDDTPIGWLGLGDIEFDNPSSVNDLFNHRKPQVCTLAIPHHGSGSNKNWNNNILHNFQHPITCVASVGVNYSHYGHPNRNVVMDINGAGSTLIVVTEDPDSQFKENAYFRPLN